LIKKTLPEILEKALGFNSRSQSLSQIPELIIRAVVLIQP